MIKEATKVCAHLKLPPAPLVIAGLETALGFFREHLRLDPLRCLDAFANIDFLHAIRVEFLTAHMQLALRNPPGDASRPFAFYTTPSTSPEDAPAQLWEVPDKMYVLASKATTLALGGRQYLLSAEDAEKLRKIAPPKAASAEQAE